ncbi:MAG: hypothetical protein ACRD7E_32220 [Bryobacteraceae bacterium]
MMAAGRAALLCAVLYWVCLRFIFPGYFAPLVPHHSDLYIPVGLLERSWTEILTYPRPVAYLALRVMGSFGLEGSIAAVIILVLLGIVLTAVLAARWLDRPPALVPLAVYIVILLAHPQFYFQHRHDVPAALSYIFLLLALGAWLRWLHNGSRAMMLACLASMGLLILTKETYAAAAICLLAGTALLEKRRFHSRWILLLGVVVAIEVLGLLLNVTRYRHFVAFASGASHPYHPSFNPLSMAATLWFYLGKLFSPAAVLLLLAALAFTGRDFRKLGFSLLSIAAGLAALLPHLVLPNHLFEEYAWIAAPLVFLPLLLVEPDRLPFKRSVLAYGSLAGFALLWIFTNHGAYNTPARQWTIQQERTNQGIVASLDRLQSLDPSARRVLVAGLRASYHPWLSSDFVQHELGRSREWTVLVPRNGPQRRDPPITLALPEQVRLDEFDHAVLYNENGTLARILDRSGLQQAAGSSPGSVLLPALEPHLDRLRKEPDHFTSLLSAGVLYLEWGWPERAVPYLERALKASGGENPYPHFFLGQAAEALRDYAAARLHYEQAIAADPPPGNSAFREALARLPQ